MSVPAREFIAVEELFLMANLYYFLCLGFHVLLLLYICILVGFSHFKVPGILA